MSGVFERSEYVWVAPTTGGRYHENPNCPGIASADVTKRLHRSKIAELRHAGELGYEECQHPSCQSRS